VEVAGRSCAGAQRRQPRLTLKSDHCRTRARIAIRASGRPDYRTENRRFSIRRFRGAQVRGGAHPRAWRQIPEPTGLYVMGYKHEICREPGGSVITACPGGATWYRGRIVSADPPCATIAHKWRRHRPVPARICGSETSHHRKVATIRWPSSSDN
jgi:hypothetical protein